MESKKQEFVKWLEDQMEGETRGSVKTEIRLLLDLCKSDYWWCHIKNRESSVFTELYVSHDLPKEVKDALTMRLFINRKAGRKLQEMEVSQ